MSSGVFLAVAILAGAACPLHMWWQQRRGRQATCCPSTVKSQQPPDLAGLRARHEQVNAQIAELEIAQRAGAPAGDSARG